MCDRFRICLLALLVLIFLVPCQCQDHYYESVSYKVEPSSSGVYLQCSARFVALEPGISSIDVTVPYPLEELREAPKVMVGKSVVDPVISEGEESTSMGIEFPPLMVGELENLVIQFSTVRGQPPEGGSRIEVRTLELGGNVTSQLLTLELPNDLTVARVETEDGTSKPGGGGPIPLSSETLTLYFVLRNKTILDNRYFRWGLIIVAISVPVALLVRRRYARTPSD